MTLQARYSGICPVCDERWQPGDLIRSEVAAAVWQHAVCPTPRPARETCGTCFTERAHNGACGCEDE